MRSGFWDSCVVAFNCISTASLPIWLDAADPSEVGINAAAVQIWKVGHVVQETPTTTRLSHNRSFYSLPTAIFAIHFLRQKVLTCHDCTPSQTPSETLLFEIVGPPPPTFSVLSRNSWHARSINSFEMGLGWSTGSWTHISCCSCEGDLSLSGTAACASALFKSTSWNRASRLTNVRCTVDTICLRLMIRVHMSCLPAPIRTPRRPSS